MTVEECDNKIHVCCTVKYSLFLFFYLYICSCVVLLLYIFFFILLHCPLSGPDLIYISLLIIPCIIYYVTNKETLNLEIQMPGDANSHFTLAAVLREGSKLHQRINIDGHWSRMDIDDADEQHESWLIGEGYRMTDLWLNKPIEVSKIIQGVHDFSLIAFWVVQKSFLMQTFRV